jgi:hypothetical protein
MGVKHTITIPEWLDKICAWPVIAYRKHKYGYTFRRIYVGEGRYAMVDPVLFYRLNRYHWTFNSKMERPYAYRYEYISNNKVKLISMHREIMNFPAGRLVDHENGNTFDNRIDNLRSATRAENAQNRGKTRTKTTSKYIGVYYDKKKNRWIVRIMCKHRKIHVGTFKDEIEAAKAHDIAAKKYHREFARLNFPELTAENPSTSSGQAAETAEKNKNNKTQRSLRSLR